MMETAASTVLVVEPARPLTETIGNRISKDWQVTVAASFSDGYSALRAIRQITPDAVILDLSLRTPSGPEMLCRLREALPDIKVIVAAPDLSIATAYQVLSQGALALIHRDADGATFADAIRAARAGFSFVPTSLIDRFVLARNTAHKAGNRFGLLAREIEVLEAFVCGLTAMEVASHLNISARTVEVHRIGILQKTACQSIADVSHLMQADGVAGESSGQMAQFMETENT